MMMHATEGGMWGFLLCKVINAGGFFWFVFFVGPVSQSNQRGNKKSGYGEDHYYYFVVVAFVRFVFCYLSSSSVTTGTYW